MPDDAGDPPPVRGTIQHVAYFGRHCGAEDHPPRAAPASIPQTEMTRYLTERGFANTPALFGELVRVDAEVTPHTLLIVEQLRAQPG